MQTILRVLFRLPQGHFVKTLGSSGDRETETEVLLLEHDVPYQEFSKRVLDDLPPEGDQWVVTEKHLTQEKRRDLRHLNICSIDPPGCTDIDDALHVRPLDNGNYEVGVRKCRLGICIYTVVAISKDYRRYCGCDILCKTRHGHG